jgi:hypothetical protein
MQMTMPSIPALDSVKLQFDHWRNTRGKHQRIPDSLWDQVIPLLEHYKISKILQTLGLNYTQLKQKRESYNQNGVSAPKISCNLKSPHQSFVSIPLPMGSGDDVSSIELTRPDGLVMRFKKIDQVTLSLLLQSFVRE